LTFGFESFGLRFEDHRRAQSSVSQSVVHNSLVFCGRFLANSLEISEEEDVLKTFVHKYLTHSKWKLKYNSH
jgi:hypothetical protein